ncbi:MAG: HDIG domain-containing protein [Candidatus Krumholzibacteriota bacterium]|nr:HDIG domain-containing protein [Candidatus Krumholzibacteriota bacterium]
MITSKDIESIFAAQLAKIKKVELRNMVVEIWVAGCAKGAWESVEELRAIPFTLLTDTKGISFIEHTIAVTEGALALARAQIDAYSKMPYPFDLDRLVAGGLLHDVGKLLEIERDGTGGYRKSHSGKCARHPISGALLAAESGADEELLNTIICHAKEGDGRPQVPETVMIHQADFATFDPLVMLSKGLLIE